MISFQLSNEHKTSSIPSGRNHETYSHIVAPKRCTKDSNYQYFQQDFTRHVYLSGNFSGKFNQVAKSIFTKFHLFVLYHYFLEAAIFKPIPPMVCLWKVPPPLGTNVPSWRWRDGCETTKPGQWTRISGWWFHPSEKYESQLGWLFPMEK